MKSGQRKLAWVGEGALGEGKREEVETRFEY